MNPHNLYQPGRPSVLRPRIMVRLFSAALLWVTVAACLVEAIR